MPKRDVVLLQDPYEPTAIAFAEQCRDAGMGVVAFYTSPKRRHYGERDYPVLKTDLLLDRYDVDLDDLESFAREVKAAYEVRAVIPWMEPTVEVAAELYGYLDIDWNDATTIGRFRDKVELKRNIARNDSSVRLPWFHELDRMDDIADLDLPTRVVVKPRAGFGNQSIGIFDGADRDAIAAHVATSDAPWIMEEYIGGTEYHVNGQIRTDGTITVLLIMQYHRVVANDYDTVYSSEERLHTDHPRFQVLADYATNLLKATGLRRSPFHMEVKVDDVGPAVIDLGARFMSEGGARAIDSFHPTRAPALEVATRDYLEPNEFAMDPVDWTHHDATSTNVIYGISAEEGRVQSIRGLADVEALPEFVRWNFVAPRGDHLRITHDLRGAPWIMEVGYDRADGDRREELVEKVRSLITINDPITPLDRLATLAVRARSFITDRLSWEFAKRRRG